MTAMLMRRRLSIGRLHVSYDKLFVSVQSGRCPRDGEVLDEKQVAVSSSSLSRCCLTAAAWLLLSVCALSKFNDGS